MMPAPQTYEKTWSPFYHGLSIFSLIEIINHEVAIRRASFSQTSRDEIDMNEILFLKRPEEIFET